ncbi:MAG: STAS domain-containing protein [Acidobacteriaceae bacterium]|jgi:anti-anti-sigma factor
MAITQEPAMRYEVEESADRATTTVRLHGRLVYETAEEIRGVVKGLIARGGRIAIDVAGVNYLDSSGLGVLVGLKVSSCKQGECRLELENITPRIQEILAITFMDDFFST